MGVRWVCGGCAAGFRVYGLGFKVNPNGNPMDFWNYSDKIKIGLLLKSFFKFKNTESNCFLERIGLNQNRFTA